ncbi:MAG: hypothetical protein WBA74_01885, partial [Cyclobacteriaceae bacterium]
MKLQPYDWKFYDEIDTLDDCEVHAWCCDEYSNTCLVRFQVKPYMYVELPEFMNNMFMDEWDQHDISLIVSALNKNKDHKKLIDDYEYEEKKHLYFYSNTKYPMLKLYFNTLVNLNKVS